MENKDILKSDNYHLNLKLFMIFFAALNLTFMYYQVTFFWGNHDWDWIKGTDQILQINTGLFEGRYAKFILNVGLYGGQILPILNNLTAFALLSAGMVFLLKYWQIKSFTALLLVGMSGILSPFILGWLYFPINIIGNFMAVFLIGVGLGWSESNNRLKNIGAIIFFIGALGVYPSAMELMIGAYLTALILQNGKLTAVKMKSALRIIGAILLFKGILYILTINGQIYQDYYNLRTIAPTELWTNLPKSFLKLWQQLILTIPFFPNSLKVCGILIIIMAIYFSLKETSNKKTICLAWIGSLFTTILSCHLTPNSEEVFLMPRVNFYGLNFFYVGCLAILIKHRNSSRNLGCIISIIYLTISVQQDFYAQKVWQFGRTAEQNLVDRVSTRIIEQVPDKQVRTPLIAGEISLRPRYYLEKYDIASPYLLNRSFLVRHIPSGMYNFYQPYPIFDGKAQISVMSPELYTYLQDNKEIWPAVKALYTDDRYIIITLTSDGNKMLKAQLPK